MKHKIQELLSNWLNRPTPSYGSNEAEGLGAIASTVGNVRQENQDRAVIARYVGRFPAESFVFYGLCDGIGGLRDGGVCASRGLATALVSLVEAGNQNMSGRMMSAATLANEDIFNRYHENGGCTYSAIGVDFRGELFGINIGDSRIYARGDGLVAQISSDDNIGSQLQLLGNVGKHTGEFSKQLTQFLGAGQSLQPKRVSLREEKQGYFITSDGVHSLGEKLLSEISCSAAVPNDVAKRIATVAMWCKGTDNGTIICTPTKLGDLVSRNPSQITGLLEIWDSYEKMQLLVDMEDLRQRPFVSQKPAVLQAGSAVTNYHQHGEKKKAVARKKKKDFQKGRGAPEIEITEDPI